ncbi:alpha/beta hydrolase family protein [Pseudoduganella sp. OTU4001]|uniref:alpha/beta hydrolase family protein n=1 Tax=Pseudoduganella sp. OTU4001 TaxID=3043854 RepID=UPI00313E1C72
MRHHLLALILCFPLHSFAADDMPAGLTIAQAIDPLGFTSAVLSPDGRHVAALGYTGHEAGLVLYDTETRKTAVLVKGRYVSEYGRVFQKDPLRATWVSNDLIAVDYGIWAESIDLSGKKVAEIGVSVIGKAEPARPDSTSLLVYDDEGGQTLAKVDARTGKKRKFDYPSAGKLRHWAFDRLGNLRAVTLVDSAFWSDDTKVVNWYRPAPDAPWQKLAEFQITDDYWTPLRVPDEDGRLLVMSAEGRETRAVFSYDTVQRQLKEVVYGHPSQDLAVVKGLVLAEPSAVVTMGMKPEQHWLDPQWSKVQQRIDEALPGRINVLSGNPAGKMLVYSYSDQDPGVWYLLERKTMHMEPILYRNREVDPAEQRAMEVMRYPARDGLSIPAYLTRPVQQAGPMPTVVLVHGGPAVRDHWNWDAEVQLLAAHGYLVFQPQFRGSAGFGKVFEQAGKGEWGRAMQDDINDGIAALVKQGLADPSRICIVGASYGGYAALWGLARDPDLYRCGVSFAGVVDIGLMLRDRSDVNRNTIGRQFRARDFGDAEANKNRYDEVSPLQHVARIKAPLMLLHGENDRRVPFEHGRRMAEALRKHGKVHEWHDIPQEGHGLRYVRSQMIYHANVLGFLATHLGGRRPLVPADFE